MNESPVLTELPENETAYLTSPATQLDDLRGDIALLEWQVRELYEFIEQRLGLNREQVIRAIAGRVDE